MSSPISSVMSLFFQVVASLLLCEPCPALTYLEERKKPQISHFHMPQTKPVIMFQSEPHNSGFPALTFIGSFPCSGSGLWAWHRRGLERDHCNRNPACELSCELSCDGRGNHDEFPRLKDAQRPAESVQQVLETHWRVRAWPRNVRIHEHGRQERLWKSRAEAAQIYISALPLTSCEALGKPLNFSEPKRHIIYLRHLLWKLKLPTLL